MKCFLCDEEIEERDFVEYSRDGEPAHERCRGDSLEYASTLVEISPDGVIEVVFDNHFVFDEGDNEYPVPIKLL